MGGVFSTRWNGTRVRATTDGALALDVRWLAKHGRLEPGYGPVAWTRNGRAVAKLGVWAGSDGIVLDYRLGGGGGTRVRERVALERTPCPLGGSRPWFRCPGCGGRVAILYGPHGIFRCRRCHGLAYPSTRQAGWQRQLAKANRLRAKLGGPPGVGRVPPPPKGMRLRTYARIVREIDALDAAALAAVREDAAAMERTLKRLAGRPFGQAVGPRSGFRRTSAREADCEDHGEEVDHRRRASSRSTTSGTFCPG